MRRRITTRGSKVVDKFRHLKFWKTLKRSIETAVREQVFQENTLLAGAADFVPFAPGKVGCVVGCLLKTAHRTQSDLCQIKFS